MKVRGVTDRPPFLALMVMVSPAARLRSTKVPELDFRPRLVRSVLSRAVVATLPLYSCSEVSTVPSLATIPPPFKLPSNLALVVSLAIVRVPTGMLRLVTAPPTGMVKSVVLAMIPCTMYPVAGSWSNWAGLRENCPMRV